MTPFQLASFLGKRGHVVCFKEFRKDNPDRYDYEKAGVCAPLLARLEFYVH